MTHDPNRVLGKSGFDVGCDACFAELDRYVELELSGADAETAIPGMRLHLESCAACHDEYESLRELAAGR
jgi:mono/diheme cytochrome c family protein